MWAVKNILVTVAISLGTVAASVGSYYGAKKLKRVVVKYVTKKMQEEFERAIPEEEFERAMDDLKRQMMDDTGEIHRTVDEIMKEALKDFSKEALKDFGEELDAVFKKEVNP